MNVKESLASFEDAVIFHGHECPGLAIGYKVATTAMQLLEVDRPHDEELVAIVENDTCAVDAVQVVTGCTFGKGNLVFRDYGKGGFSFFSREKKKGLRIRYRKFPSLDEPDQVRMAALKEKLNLAGAVPESERRELAELRQKLIHLILACKAEDFLGWRSLEEDPPDRARIWPSVLCESCKEDVMETRILDVDGRRLCVPCAENAGETGRRP